MTYLWIPALAIEMTLRDGRPVAFVWHGRVHRVAWIARQWRVDVAWWRLRVWRDNYKLVTDTGLLVVVYCDLLEEKWYLQQLFD